MPITSPFILTLPSSTPKSTIFTKGSLIFKFVPYICGVSSCSSSEGNSGILLSSSNFAIIFAIIVISPAYVSNPAFPIIFSAFD